METKNPLGVFFGSFLQSERKRKKAGIAIHDLAEQLGISSSLYKMIESGNAPFNIARLFDLIKVFDETNLEFDRLSKYFVGLNYIDFVMKKSDNPKLAKEALASLADNDEEFKVFFHKTEKYFDIIEGSKDQKEFIQDTVINEVSRFLSLRNYTEIISTNYTDELAKQIHAMPTLNIEIVQDVIHSFGKIYPQHFGHIAQEWEDQNCNNFKSVEGFYTNPKFIVSKKNLSAYNYPYLSKDGFTDLRFLFITDEKTNIHLQDEFKRILNEARTGNKKIPESDIKKKVHFKTLKRKDKRLADIKKDLLRDPNQEGNMEMQALWIFTTTKGNKIGFIGSEDSSGDFNKVYNLSYDETYKRSSALNQIWESIV